MNITTRPQRTCCASSMSAGSRMSGARKATSSRLRHRVSVMVLVALGAVAVPHSAAALMPLPPPPVRFPILDVGRAILTLAESYAEAPLTEKRQLHNEMSLTLNATRATI
ncbi:hypothetical protein [Terrabacter sp. MAHUQ-38]|uniref:hypothetical protein n=1 Tax=unclassified Terrabacter TaxID=2630222 RepID=UPI00165D97E7|nr:hypothetical protein [Terrabacter sp. MAHUQ-38]MBC9821157.1 hypothetical protein [Terrabacter sp. MAHUQ-38]